MSQQNQSIDIPHFAQDEHLGHWGVAGGVPDVPGWRNHWENICETRDIIGIEQTSTRWYIYIYWLVVWNIFPYIGNNHPNWLIFFRGVETTNQYIYSYKHKDEKHLLKTNLMMWRKIQDSWDLTNNNWDFPNIPARLGPPAVDCFVTPSQL